jgi:alpha-beta hydrolase superfamily lysophospholipase
VSTLPLGQAPDSSLLSPSITLDHPVPTDHSVTGRRTRAVSAVDPTVGAVGSDGDGVGAGGPDGPVIDAFYRIPSPLVAAPPGSVIRSGVIDSAGQLPAGATAYRVIYHSESVTGTDIAVSGMVVVPGGTPPANGFPIVSWAHGTTGLADRCAPSISGFGSIPYLSSLINDRMIVAATDYQGLGTPGVHPYLVGQSEAQGVLDAARAARDLVGRAASNSVVVFGYSQGGQAALFAGQIAQSYAPELYVAGVAAVAPFTSITEWAPAVPRSRADGDAGFAAMALDAWSATYGDPPLDSLLTKPALHDVALMNSACSGAVTSAYDGTPTDLIFRPGWSTNPAVRAEDAANEPGHAPISAPVLVVQGTADSLIPYAATTSLVTDALCHNQHDAVRYVPISGASHDGALVAGGPIIVQWISKQLTGTTAPGTCTVARTSTTG